MIKSLAPLPTAALSVVFEKKSFSWEVWASMLLVVAGTILAAIGNTEFKWGGALLCLVSVLASAGWNVCAAMLLQSGEKKMSAVDLVFYSSPWAVFFTSIIFVSGPELRRLIDWSTDPSADRLGGGIFVTIIICGGLLGFSYDLIHNQFVKLTSSMTMAIMGNTKLIVLIVISMLTLEDKHALTGSFAMNICGVVVGVVGCIWYSWSKLYEKKPPPPLSAGALKEPLAKARPAGEASKLLDSKGRSDK